MWVLGCRCAITVDTLCLLVSKQLNSLGGKVLHSKNRTRCQRDKIKWIYLGSYINHLKPNNPYRSRTAPLTSKRCILYIYSTNTGTEYFKHGIYSSFFSSSKCSLFHNSNVFGSCIIHILYTGCAKIQKNNSGAKRLNIRVGYIVKLLYKFPTHN